MSDLILYSAANQDLLIPNHLLGWHNTYYNFHFTREETDSERESILETQKKQQRTQAWE